MKARARQALLLAAVMAAASPGVDAGAAVVESAVVRGPLGGLPGRMEAPPAAGLVAPASPLSSVNLGLSAHEAARTSEIRIVPAASAAAPALAGAAVPAASKIIPAVDAGPPRASVGQESGRSAAAREDLLHAGDAVAAARDQGGASAQGRLDALYENGESRSPDGAAPAAELSPAVEAGADERELLRDSRGWSKLSLSPRGIANAIRTIHADEETRRSVEWIRRSLRIPFLSKGYGYPFWHIARRAKLLLFMEKAAPRLPEAEEEAIRFYCGSFFRRVNTLLRTFFPASWGGEERASVAIARLIGSGINRLPDYRGTVYRFTKADPKLEFRWRYPVGAIVEEPSFTSSSRRDKVIYIDDPDEVFYSGEFGAYNPNYVFKPHHYFKFVILSKTGKRIDYLSYRPFEAEVLFRPGTKFLVRGNIQDTSNPHYDDYEDQFIIHLEEL